MRRELLVFAAMTAAPLAFGQTPTQVKELDSLGAVYQQAGREYEDTLRDIIKVHYEVKKRTLLTGLNQEIEAERAELKRSRETAIKTLEEFVRRYEPLALTQDCSAASVTDHSYCETTPDALYRLAALHEEVAREDNAPLDSAIGIYRRVIEGFPHYSRLAAIYYYLGHAQNDGGHPDQARSAWRSLVCHNVYPSIDSPAIAKDPFPSTCAMLPQPLLPSEDPKYVAEVWWQLGNFEFDKFDRTEGSRDLNHAASAYEHALVSKRPPIYGVTLYKYAWTLFKQQRYEAATKQFVQLLIHTDELERGNANVGDFRSEAFTYIAGSLANADFAGPDASASFSQRPDVTDLGPTVAEKKLHVAVDRVRDPNVIPQDRSWTIDIYRALGTEFQSLSQFGNALEVYEAVLGKWPLHRAAPDVQMAIATTYDQRLVGKQGAERDAISAKALEARTKLAAYVGQTPWTQAMKDDQDALQNAERLSRRALHEAAVAHTNAGRQYVALAELERARSEYALAATAWAAYISAQDDIAETYESQFWLADARNKDVRIQMLLHQRKKGRAGPTSKELDDAKTAATLVRDSNEDDKYVDVAALMVVEEADIARDLAYEAGLGRRTDLEMVGTGDDATIKLVQIPTAVALSLKARDEYIQRVPATKDAGKNTTMFAFHVADTYFVYGDVAEARPRFEALYKEHCGKDEYGYRAWEKLITIAARTGDRERGKVLADAEAKQSCGVTDAQRGSGGALSRAYSQELQYIAARRVFDTAQKEPPGPNKDKLFRQAAALYEAALVAAPDRDEAVEGAMNAAYAYKAVSDYERAIKMYELFVRDHGKEESLKGLSSAKLKERVGYWQTAQTALASAHYGAFNYDKAAEAFAAVAKNARFDESERKSAALNAVTLFNVLGQYEKLDAVFKVGTKLTLTPDERARMDYVQASRSPASLAQFFNANKSNAAASTYVIEAAWRVGRTKHAAGDTAYRAWFANTVATWDAWNGAQKQAVPYSDYAAEAEYVLIDDELKDKFDYETGHHRYVTMSVLAILGDEKTEGQWTKDLKVAGDYDQKLIRAQRFKSIAWTPAFLARQGSLYDSLRTGLYACAGSQFNPFTAKQSKILDEMRQSGVQALIDRAEAFEVQVRDGWKTKRDQQTDQVDALMVARYAQAIALARGYSVMDANVARAMSRMALFTDVIGDAKLRADVTATSDPIHPQAKLPYTDRMYDLGRPGLVVVPSAQGTSVPLPLAP